MTDETPVKPHLEIHPNPVKGAGFTHYEIQTVREYADPSGEHFVERWTDSEQDSCEDFAVGEVIYAIYGRYPKNGVRWLLDCATLEDAREVLSGFIGTLDKS